MRMRPLGLILISAGALFGAGCLDMVVPLHGSGASPDGSATTMNPTDDLATAMPPDDDGGTTQPVVDMGMGKPLDMSDCIAKSATVVDGHHNPGQDCLTCHGPNPAAGAPQFLVAGTLFNAVGGTTGVAQATIRLTDGAGKHLDLTTASSAGSIGNFFVEVGNAQGLTPPFTVEASSCPNTQRMSAQVTAANLSCNNCHNGTKQAHIHLP